MIIYHGKVFIVEKADIGSYNLYEMENKFMEVENIAIEKTGHGIDICIVDHINLLKFGDNKIYVLDTINKYATFFREQALDWCGTGKEVAMIVLSQSNKAGGDYASSNLGKYLLGHFAEGNELQRSSSLIFTTYYDGLKERIYLIKSRDCETAEDVIVADTDLEYYTFGDTTVLECEKRVVIPRFETLGLEELDYGV